MSWVYTRGRKLWIGYRDPEGKVHQVSTGLNVGDEKKAKKVAEKLDARFAATESFGPIEDGPITVRRYATRWVEDRIKAGLASAVDDESRFRLHALPGLGAIKLEDVRPRHIRDLVKKLRADGKLAPRSVRHVYGLLHTMFKDATVDELIDTNPCVLTRGDLPKIVDKDPTWRAGAVFTRGELEQLISDERLPPDRRMLYALLGMAGLRFGEASALRWRTYDTTLEPLGRLLIASSWQTRRKQEKSTKTEQPRQVPVHPVLARLLAEWKLDGWQLMMGRAAGPDDLIIPSRQGLHRSRHHGLEKFSEDLIRLGLRHRRQHDLRRTFISLARTDGARKDVLETITHGQRGSNIMDLYTTPPWPLLCEEVAKLKVKPLAGRVLQMQRRLAVGAGDGDAPDLAPARPANQPTAAEAFSSIAHKKTTG
jgi:integrase